MIALCQGGTRNACDWLAFCQKSGAVDPACGFYCDLDPQAQGCQQPEQPNGGAKRPWYKHPAAIVAGGALACTAVVIGVKAVV